MSAILWVSFVFNWSSGTRNRMIFIKIKHTHTIFGIIAPAAGAIFFRVPITTFK
jgi:hypothetical protein